MPAHCRQLGRHTPKKGISVFNRTKSGADHREHNAQKPKLPILQAEISDKNESLLKLELERTASQRLLAKLEIAGQL